MGYLGRVMKATRSWLSTLGGGNGPAYNSTDVRRKYLEGIRFPKNTADEALALNLSQLIAQCRHLVRNTPLGRAVSDGFKAEVIGTGITVLSKASGEADAKILQDGFHLWAESCGVNGESLWELQHQGAGEIPEAGAILWRFLVLPDRIDRGLIPLCIQPLEVEWLSEIAVAAIDPANFFVRGIEQDYLGRPKFYHLRNPSATSALSFSGQFSGGERVAASEIIHCFEKRRPLQSHGEPGLAPCVERVLQDGELINIELKAANNTAAMAVAITSESHDDATDDDGDPVTDIPLGATVRLHPGEEAKAIHMERPNQLIAPFRATIRGDVAAATRTSQYWLNRDMSGATYMNSRMDQQKAQQLLAPIKLILGRHIAGVPFQRVVPYLMLKAGRPMPRNEKQLENLLSYELRPDEPEYVDPVKDGEAAAFLIGNNLSTLEQELASRGKDINTVLAQRAKENAQLASLGLPIPGIQPASATANKTNKGEQMPAGSTGSNQGAENE